jgi:hypothetical protein
MPKAPPLIPPPTASLTQLDVSRVMAELTQWSKFTGNALLDLDADMSNAPDIPTGDQMLAFAIWTATEAVISEASTLIVPNTATAPYRGDRYKEAMAMLARPVVGMDGTSFAANISEAMLIVESLMTTARDAINQGEAARAGRTTLVEHLAVIRTLSKDLEMGASELSSLETASAATSPATSAVQIQEIVARATKLRATLEAAIDERSSLLLSLEEEPAKLKELAELEAKAREVSARTVEKFTHPPRLGILSVDALGPTPPRPDLTAQPWPAVRAILAARAQKLERAKQSLTIVVAKNTAMLDERQSLRGLVDAYRAKAMASRIGETAAVAAAYAKTRDLLWSAPCDLDAGRIAANEYISLVGGTPTTPTHLTQGTAT